MLYIDGRTYNWYHELYSKALRDGQKIPSRQGPSLELDDPLHIEIPAADSFEQALIDCAVPRRDLVEKRLLFSVAHGVQKLLGLPDSYLSGKFPILNRYIREDEETGISRLNSYTRELLPEKITADAPWIKICSIDDNKFSSIDQLHLCIERLLKSEENSSRRALINFDEGYKPRCVSSWHFTIRDKRLNMYQNIRSNDLLVGLPNDLLSARIVQLIIASFLGLGVGRLHHHSSIVQVYLPDCAGVDGAAQYNKILKQELFSKKAIDSISSLPFIQDLKNKIMPIKCNVSDVAKSLALLRAELQKVLDDDLLKR